MDSSPVPPGRKAVRQNLLAKDGKPAISTELYNLAEDPGETKDVSAQYPEIVQRLERVLRREHTPSAEFPIPALDLGEPAEK
jgi:arylsulfatase